MVKEIKENQVEGKSTNQVSHRTFSAVFKALTIMIIIASIVILNIDHMITYYNKSRIQHKQEPHENSANSSDITLYNKDVLDFEDTIEAEVEKEKLEALEIKDIEKYRSYLVATGKLIRKLSADTDYDQEINYLLSSGLEYPDEIKDALKQLKLHREKYLSANNKQYKEVSIEGNFIKNMLGKIVSIKQVNPLYNSMAEDRDNLQGKAFMIEEYFYSPEFLKYCISYD